MNRKNNILGERISHLRKNANLKQGELAELLKISYSTLSLYESGRRIPNDELKIKLADYFNVSVDYLIGHSPKENSMLFKTLSTHQRALLEISEKLSNYDLEKVLEYTELLAAKHKRE